MISRRRGNQASMPRLLQCTHIYNLKAFNINFSISFFSPLVSISSPTVPLYPPFNLLAVLSVVLSSILARLHRVLEGSIHMANHPAEKNAQKLCQKTEERKLPTTN